MRTTGAIRLAICCCLVLFACQSAFGQDDSPKGKLVIVGGGGTPGSVMKKTIELGGENASVVVIPYASARPEAGEELVEFFQSHGASSVEVLDLKSLDNGLKQLEDANVVWMGGGSQNRLMDALPAEVVECLKNRYRQGCVVGGTSAGAAVMSKLMITGDADLESIRAGTTVLADGLGLTNLIVDQHFHRRQRFNRLLSAVLDHPKSIGVGIDERTAIIVSGNEFEVAGESNVIVVDATDAEVATAEPGELHSETGAKLHVLKAGQTYEFEQD